MVDAGNRYALRVATALLNAVLLAGCTQAAPEVEREEVAAARATAGEPTTVQVGGIRVTVPADGVPAGSTLQVEARDVPAGELPAHLVAAGDSAAVVELDGGALSQPATVSFPVPEDAVDADFFPVVVWEDGEGGWRWLPAEYTPGDATITASTDHFSWGFLGKIDVKKWAADRKDDAVGFLSGRAGVEQPRCGDEDAARADGTEVASDAGDSVKWCVGVERGQRIMRIANNRRTFTQVTYPSGWKVAESSDPSVSLEALNHAFSTGAAAVSAPRGMSVRVISGGDTLTLVVTPGSSGTVLAEVSFFGWALSALQFGVETYAAVASAASQTAGKAATNAWDEIMAAIRSGADTAVGDDYQAAFAACSLNAGEFSGELPSFAGDLTRYAWTCVPNLMQAYWKNSPVTFFAKAVVLATVATVVSLVYSALNLLITGVREIVDSIASFGGRSDPIYDIVLATPKPTDPYAVRFDGIGDFTLSLTADDLSARGFVNEGNLYEGMEAACVRYARDGDPVGASVDSATGRVLALSNAGGAPLYTEVGGLRAGSTLAEVREVFSRPGHQISELLDLDFGQGTNGVIITSSGGAIGLALDDASPADYASGAATVSHVAGVGLPGHAPTNMEDGC
ncbi:hypothetical protein [Blastococcus atacamensis]|uniref:hypothetical protein n=1 Tax=Blastococcus atacamensis TaxID=2070508 RepID=UPI000CEBC9AD|nr:hypothetical protein [Blastococcus atacamensis]